MPAHTARRRDENIAKQQTENRSAIYTRKQRLHNTRYTYIYTQSHLVASYEATYVSGCLERRGVASPVHNTALESRTHAGGSTREALCSLESRSIYILQTRRAAALLSWLSAVAHRPGIDELFSQTIYTCIRRGV